MARPFIGAIVGAVATVYGAKKAKKAQKAAANEARRQEEAAAAEAKKQREHELALAQAATMRPLTPSSGAAPGIAPSAIVGAPTGALDAFKPYLPYVLIGGAALVAVAVLRR